MRTPWGHCSFELPAGFKIAEHFAAPTEPAEAATPAAPPLRLFLVEDRPEPPAKPLFSEGPADLDVDAFPATILLMTAPTGSALDPETYLQACAGGLASGIALPEEQRIEPCQVAGAEGALVALRYGEQVPITCVMLAWRADQVLLAATMQVATGQVEARLPVLKRFAASVQLDAP